MRNSENGLLNVYGMPVRVCLLCRKATRHDNRKGVAQLFQREEVVKMEYELTEECLRKDLKVPKGFRLAKDWELLKLLRTDKKIKEVLKKEYVWCNTLNGVRAAGLYCNDVSFHISGYDSIIYPGRSRGVLTKMVKDKCPHCGEELPEKKAHKIKIEFHANDFEDVEE